MRSGKFLCLAMAGAALIGCASGESLAPEDSIEAKLKAANVGSKTPTVKGGLPDKDKPVAPQGK